ncbi:MAG TPA: carboxypeptidase-like regulatory domain-containing protein, partial [Blastocatellia bacterium]|nr:carboxypeptidase-like regulatory domain-containing protein [Blastocatellia bacterium]
MWFCLLVLTLTCATPIASAQSVSARLEGVVSDQAQALVPGAKVVVTNNRTGLGYEAVANESGRFVFVSLPPGNYQLAVSQAGFKKFLREGVLLQVGDAVTINAELQQGDINESVSVTAETPLLDQTTSKIGSVVQNRQAVELPLNGRNALSLFYLVAGTNPFDRAQTSQQQRGGIDGLAPHTNNTKVEGVLASRSSVDNSPSDPNVPVPQEAVGEYRITTSGALAEAGRGSGAQISVSLKSGTNQLHGSLFEFNRNPVYNANDFFNNRAGVKRPDVKRHQFGGSIGGPIIKNRTFFFFTIEGDRQKLNLIENRFVYTAPVRDGIFRYNTTGANTTAVVDARGNPLVPVSTINLFTVDPSRQGRDTLFVPKILQVMPQPNNYEIGDGLNVAGYRYNASNPNNAYQYLIKVDHKLSERHQLSASFSYLKNTRLTSRLITGDPAEEAILTKRGGALRLVSTFTSKLVNELSIGSNYQNPIFNTLKGGETPEGNIQLTGLGTDNGLFGTRNGNIFINRGVQGDPNTNLGFSDNLTWIRGNHSLSFGGDLWFQTENIYFNNNAFPAINTNNAFNPATVPALTGLNANDRARAQQLVNDLTGSIGSITQNFVLTNKAGYAPYQSTYLPAHNLEWSVYVQDLWKIRRNLSLNLGLRYEMLPPAYLANDTFVQPIGGVEGALGIQGPTKQPTRFGLVGNKGRDAINTDYNNFGPHFGFSWDPFGKGDTTISGSYRVAYDRSMLLTYGFFSAQNYGASTTVTLQPFTRLSDPNLYKTILPIATPTLFAPLGFTRDSRAYVVERDLKTPYVQSWSLQVARQIGGNWKVEAAYVGNHAVGQWQAVNLNQVEMRKNGFLDAFKVAQRNLAANGNPTRGDSLGNLTALFNAVPASQYVLITQGQAAALANFLDTTTLVTGRRGGLITQSGLPDTFFRFNPQVLNLNVIGNNSHSTWNGLKLSLTRRLAEGLYLHGNYTFGKGFTNYIPGQVLTNDFRDNANQGLDKALSPLDSTHVVLVNGLYELPLGRGKRFLDGAPRVVDWVLGGWQLNGIYSYASGRPLQITTGRFNLSANIASTPNFSGTPFNLSNPQDLNGRISTVTAQQLAQFTNPGAGEAGGLSRYSFRGPGYSSLDISLFKSFRKEIRGHELQVQFRAEAFNFLNQTVFQNPDVNINGGNFGVITSSYAARIGQLALKIVF